MAFRPTVLVPCDPAADTVLMRGHERCHGRATSDDIGGVVEETERRLHVEDPLFTAEGDAAGRGAGIAPIELVDGEVGTKPLERGAEPGATPEEFGVGGSGPLAVHEGWARPGDRVGNGNAIGCLDVSDGRNFHQAAPWSRAQRAASVLLWALIFLNTF